MRDAAPRLSRAKSRGFALLVPVLLGLMFVAPRAQQGAPAANPRVVTTHGPETFTSRVVATGLNGPWEIIWGPDGFLWVTERVGKRIVRVNPATGEQTVVLAIDEVSQTLAQDGLLGMALHADEVYVAYTYDADAGPALVRRMKLRRYTYDRRSGQLTAPVDLLTDLPHGTDHGAGRVVFGPDGKLYLSRGDHGNNFLANYCDANHAQDLPTAADVQARNWTMYQGKILRINPDGSIPNDNPVLNGVRSHVYSYGHRNPQGLTFVPGGRLFDSEHGESIDDEVNLVLPGRNYGWPFIAGYQDDQSYTYANWSASAPEPCASLQFNVLNPPPSVPRRKESTYQLRDFMPPAKTFFTVPNGYDLRALGNATTAPAGLDVYTSSAIPGWRNSLLLTTMISGVVFRMPLTDDARNPLGAPVPYFKTVNRYRDIAIAPDGIHFYLATDPDGRTVGPGGALTRDLANPNSILEFVYTRAGT